MPANVTQTTDMIEAGSADLRDVLMVGLDGRPSLNHNQI